MRDRTSMDPDRIVETCRDLWQDLLGLRLDEARQPEGTPDPSEAVLASYVQLSGPWEGAFVVRCAESVTRHAAAMLFQEDAEDLTESDLQDALNELTRLIGKNVQRKLGEAGKVSSPKSLPAGELPPSLASMRDAGELDLDCEGRPVRIAVREGVTATVA